MKNVINEHLPAIGEMSSRSLTQVAMDDEMRKQRDSLRLEAAYEFGICHIPIKYERGKSFIDVFNELPEYILIKDREFKKDLERTLIKDFGTCTIPFAVYKAVDGNIMECGPFVWLKCSQVSPTRILTMKY